jgi:hypothetical protein
MKTIVESGSRSPRYLQAFFASIFLTTVFAFSAAYAGPGGKGANGGGGGGPTRGAKPTVKEVTEHVKGWSAIRVLGYLYSEDGEKTPTFDPTLQRMTEKISKGLKVEIRTSGPCLDGSGEPNVASIYSKVADICFNPQIFIEQKEMTITRRTFEYHLDALLAHEILHLVQKDQKVQKGQQPTITEEDERAANLFQQKYIDAAEDGHYPGGEDFLSLATSANEALKISRMTLETSRQSGFKVRGSSQEEEKQLCNIASNYQQYVQPLLLYSTGVIVNHVHLISMDSDYWMRDEWMWRAAFKSSAEQDFITKTPRGKKYEIQPSFIQIAEKMKRYHCFGSNDFSSYREQTFRRQEEMYNEYRNIMLKQVDFIAKRTLEVFVARFQAAGDEAGR